MAAPGCVVLREGKVQTVGAVDVVPGDVVLLETGNNVAADMRCIETVELKTNEALLTGESEDISKTLRAKDYDTPFATNLCFASTIVTNGSGRGLVFATGMETQVGRIAQQLKKAGEGSRLTPLQRGLNRLGGMIGLIAICVLIIVVVVAILTGYRDPAHPDADPAFTVRVRLVLLDTPELSCPFLKPVPTYSDIPWQRCCLSGLDQCPVADGATEPVLPK